VANPFPELLPHRGFPESLRCCAYRRWARQDRRIFLCDLSIRSFTVAYYCLLLRPVHSGGSFNPIPRGVIFPTTRPNLNRLREFGSHRIDFPPENFHSFREDDSSLSCGRGRRGCPMVKVADVAGWIHPASYAGSLLRISLRYVFSPPDRIRFRRPSASLSSLRQLLFPPTSAPFRVS